MALTPENEKTIDRLMKSEDPAMVSYAWTLLERYTAPQPQNSPTMIRKKRTAQPKREPEPQPKLLVLAREPEPLKAGPKPGSTWHTVYWYVRNAHPKEVTCPELMQALNLGLKQAEAQLSRLKSLEYGYALKPSQGRFLFNTTATNIDHPNYTTPAPVKKVVIPRKSKNIATANPPSPGSAISEYDKVGLTTGSLVSRCLKAFELYPDTSKTIHELAFLTGIPALRCSQIASNLKRKGLVTWVCASTYILTQ